MISLQRRLLSPPEPVAPERKTPPPSRPSTPVVEQETLEGTTDDPWKISTSDLTPTPAHLLPLLFYPPAAPEVNKGMSFQSLSAYYANLRLRGTIPWLFDDNFCSHWGDIHVCLNVGFLYKNAALVKWVVRTTCPDRFFSKKLGPAPPGEVSVTVTALRTGQIEHHIIPASCLTPAAPKGKGNTCLILSGDNKGQVHSIRECKTKKRQVILTDGTTLSFDDVCWVIQTTPS